MDALIKENHSLYKFGNVFRLVRIPTPTYI